MMKRWALVLLVVGGCAGTQRSCASGCASSYGADWVVVQYDCDGESYRCWELHDTSMANEEHSDGVYWLSPDGHLVHISNNYNRIQVGGGDWAGAYREAGISREACLSLSGEAP